MLSPATYELLADTQAINQHALRLFLRLIVTYDLRTWVAINREAVIPKYKSGDHWRCRLAFDELLKSGLIEAGERLGGDWRLYRINPAMLLTRGELDEYYRQQEEAAARMSLVG
jgi:hypothetical protein